MGLSVFLFLQVGGGWLVLKLKLMLTQPPTKLELELGLSLSIKLIHLIFAILKFYADVPFILFLRLGRWVGGWPLNFEIMLTQPPTKLELELGLSLAINEVRLKCTLGMRTNITPKICNFQNSRKNNF